MFGRIRWFAGLLALASAGASHADPCGGVVSGVSLTGHWMRTVDDGIVSYRRPESGEALTMAVYRLEDRQAG